MTELEKALHAAQDEAARMLDAYGTDDRIIRMQLRGICTNIKFALNVIHAADRARKRLCQVRQQFCDRFQKTK